MIHYKAIVKELIETGTLTENRTGVNSISLFGKQYKYQMRDGFPILTTRYQDFRKIVIELLWFIKGDGCVDFLDEHNVKLWKPWTDPDTNSVGPLYPVQWRNYVSIIKDENGYHEEKIDQLQIIIDNIRQNPYSRRHVVSAWNPTYNPDESLSPIDNVKEGKMALSPCHTLFQFSVRKLNLHDALLHENNLEVLCDICRELSSIGEITIKNPTVSLRVDNSPERVKECATIIADYIRNHPEKDFSQYDIWRNGLSLQLYQRSWDVGAAGGWNVSQYALLLHMVAKITNLIPLEFIHSIGDIHVYEDQLPALSEQLTRDVYPLPRLVINGEQKEIDDFTIDNFELIDYKHHDKLYIPVAT